MQWIPNLSHYFHSTTADSATALDTYLIDGRKGEILLGDDEMSEMRSPMSSGRPLQCMMK